MESDEKKTSVIHCVGLFGSSNLEAKKKNNENIELCFKTLFGPLFTEQSKVRETVNAWS